jgi:hypothetical protein
LIKFLDFTAAPVDQKVALANSVVLVAVVVQVPGEPRLEVWEFPARATMGATLAVADRFRTEPAGVAVALALMVRTAGITWVAREVRV